MDFSKLATILYPISPCCGAPSKSAEETDYDRNGPHAGNALRHQTAAGHPHPYLQAANMAWMAGNQIYKRFGGLKSCTRCGHEFR